MNRPPLRSTWVDLADAQLLAGCEVDTYRASGPGGQKRNKTSSAVRLRHESGLIVIAEESRSQHENKARALQRLRRALYLELREPIDLKELPAHPGWQAALNADGRLVLGRKDPRFWSAVGVALDTLAAVEGRVSAAAAALGVSTANLVDFLQTDPRVWQQANGLRVRFGQKPLKS